MCTIKLACHGIILSAETPVIPIANLITPSIHMPFNKIVKLVLRISSPAARCPLVEPPARMYP